MTIIHCSLHNQCLTTSLVSNCPGFVDLSWCTCTWTRSSNFAGHKKYTNFAIHL
uniref:Uncharacterized protein n=1 Tax=Anguilla anguilla TaxID=7936 RepID=A0A0E9X3F4_ANGAN